MLLHERIFAREKVFGPEYSELVRDLVDLLPARLKQTCVHYNSKAYVSRCVRHLNPFFNRQLNTPSLSEIGSLRNDDGDTEDNVN